MKYIPKTEKEILCPLEHGLDIFGGKWKSRILCVLSMQNVLRYNELKKELANITDAVLAAMLKDLINDNMIERTQYNAVPPRVEYSLTKVGKTALPVLQHICVWSQNHTADASTKKLTPCKHCTIKSY